MPNLVVQSLAVGAVEVSVLIRLVDAKTDDLRGHKERIAILQVHVLRTRFQYGFYVDNEILGSRPLVSADKFHLGQFTKLCRTPGVHNSAADSEFSPTGNHLLTNFHDLS